MNILRNKQQDETLDNLVNQLEKLIGNKDSLASEVLQLSQVIDVRIVEIMKEKFMRTN